MVPAFQTFVVHNQNKFYTSLGRSELTIILLWPVKFSLQVDVISCPFPNKIKQTLRRMTPRTYGEF